MQAPFRPTSQLRDRIDDALQAFIASSRASSAAPELFDELSVLIAAGGKRIRPVFCYWGHLAAGGRDGNEIVRAGAALELLHTFAIIHDDVMDRSPARRGRPASYLRLRVPAEDMPHRGDPDRFGVSAAILAGDLALVLADRMLDESGFAPERLASARQRFDAMRMGAVSGQYLDLVAAHRGHADEGEARRIASLKSGGYTVSDPLLIGSALAGSPPAAERALAAYGRPLGEAFQLRDDVLGAVGDPAVTGKDRDGDLREGKQTVLLAKARVRASADQLRLLDALVGRDDLTPGDADAIRAIFRETGALADTLALIDALADQAKAALDPEALVPEAADALTALADLVAYREA